MTCTHLCTKCSEKQRLSLHLSSLHHLYTIDRNSTSNKKLWVSRFSTNRETNKAKHAHTSVHHLRVKLPLHLIDSAFVRHFVSLLLRLLFILHFPLPRLTLQSTHTALSRWWIWWASQGEGVRPLMQRQMPPVPRQPPLRFNVIQRDRLIKRRLRDVPGPSLSRRDRLVTSGSRVLQPRHGGGRMETLPQEHALTPMHRQASPSVPLLSPCHRSSGFMIIHVFTGKCPRPCFN